MIRELLRWLFDLSDDRFSWEVLHDRWTRRNARRWRDREAGRRRRLRP